MMARPERFELPTTRFEAEYSIQLSYGRADNPPNQRLVTPWSLRLRCGKSSSPKRLIAQPEQAQFEPTLDFFEARCERSLPRSPGEGTGGASMTPPPGYSAHGLRTVAEHTTIRARSPKSI
jgi:hypothetical protein